MFLGDVGRVGFPIPTPRFFTAFRMTRGRLEKLFTLFYKKHILRPKGLWHYFTMIWRSPDSWIRFLSHLTAFLKFAWTNKRHA